MKTKLISLTTLLFFAVVICTPASVHADPPSLAIATIGASGSLGTVTQLDVNIIGGTGLVFTSDGTNLAVTAPQEVEILFNDNNQGFQSIIVSTDNRDAAAVPLFTGTIDLTGAGLVNEGDTTAAAPLHWVIFPTEAEASAYSFSTFLTGLDAGKIDNEIQFFVVDRSQSNFDTADVLGFTTVIAGVTGKIGSLANAPWDASGPGSQDPLDQREVSNGTAYMKFAVDYNGQPAGDYSTSTLTLDLATLA